MFWVGLGSATFILLGIVTAFAPQLYRTYLLGPISPTFDNSGFSGNQIPSVLELAGAIACLFYGLILIWALLELRQKSRTALLLIQCLFTLTIIFALFRFPSGIVIALLNVLALILTNSNTVKSWVAKS